MIDPLSLGLAGGGLLLQQINEMRAAETAQQALEFQKQNAAQQLQFAKAGRTDAYGNRTTFDDALNQWITQLTPEQQSLVSAGEREQRLGLTTDAARNRAIREAQFNRGRQADEDFQQARAGYLYSPRKSEGDLMGEITSLLTNARGEG